MACGGNTDVLPPEYNRHNGQVGKKEERRNRSRAIKERKTQERNEKKK